jgi:hypothetical protein
MAKLKGGTLLEAKDILVDLYRRQNPRGGRAAAERAVMAELGPQGRRRVAEAERQVAAKRARKAAAESAKRAESLKARVDAAIAEAFARPEIRETLTAATAAKAAGATGDGSSVLAALGTGRESPFWRPQPGAASQGAGPGEPPVPLHQMDPGQLRDYAGGQFAAHAQVQGFGSPIWQAG